VADAASEVRAVGDESPETHDRPLHYHVLERPVERRWHRWTIPLALGR